MRTVRLLFFAHLSSVTALLAAVILSFITTLGITEELGDLGAAQWWRAVAVSAVRIPQTFHESFPYAVIIGSAVAFALLDKGREMTVLRTSGLKLGATVAMVLQVGLLWGIVHFLVGELLVSPAAKVEKRLKLDASSAFISAAEDIWVIDGNSYLRIGSISTDGARLGDLTMFTLDASGDVESVSEIEFATRESDAWELQGIWRLTREPSWEGRRIERETWRAQITPEIIESFTTRPRQMSARELWALTSFLERNRQESRRFEHALWERFAASLSVPLFMLAGLCFVSYRRNVSVGGAVGLSLLVTVAYYMFTQIVGQLTLASASFPVGVGALAPAALWGLGVLAILRLRERK